ncbi:hypothetical protein FZEAL_3101 [Fusarium zealandicum]|uniref:Uncharacterized protein n=1 Tax=Fusarium zealandicum TaxID=1053134 RepID=A0A8H4UPV8_9HYPO|nr:hypothetical protein FZEAL_3101 [Fusarium zealandicum]
MPQLLGFVHYLEVKDINDTAKLPDFLNLIYGRGQYLLIENGTETIEVRVKKQDPRNLTQLLRDMGFMEEPEE